MRPTTLSAALSLILLGTCGFLHAESLWVPMGSDIQGEAHRDSWGSDLDIDHNGTVIAAAAHANAGNGVNAGYVRSFACQDTSGRASARGLGIAAEGVEGAAARHLGGSVGFVLA